MSVEVAALVMGEALWDLRAPRGRTFADAASLRMEPGGAAVNVALALARLGHRTALAAAVGADALGEALAARVAARGVDTALVERTPQRTGLVLVERRGEPEQRIVGYRQADEAVPRSPAPFRARVLVLTGLLPSPEQDESFGDATRRARPQNTCVVVDLNARPRVWRGRETASPPPWLGAVDIVKASDEDLATMRLTEATLRAALAPSAALVVTRGPGPARATGPFGSVELGPRPRRGPALGAGDAFVAGVCDALLREENTGERGFWERALARGHALAGQHVGR